MLLTGGSADEARAARWEDIDLQERVWRMPVKLAAGSTRKPRPRRIVLGDAVALLLAALRADPEAKGPVFPGLASDASRSRLELAWKSATERAGVAGLGLERLHPMLASGILKGLSPALTQALLGLRERATDRLPQPTTQNRH
jgi:integrase